jgi:hypothetical protein
MQIFMWIISVFEIDVYDMFLFLYASFVLL